MEDAERNLNKALQIYKELHGENHRIIAANLNYLGYAYLQMGKVQKAKETLERAVEIMDNLSPPHPGNLSLEPNFRGNWMFSSTTTVQIHSSEYFTEHRKFAKNSLELKELKRSCRS